MESYSSIRQLNSRLRAGKVNVVYEPTTYTISDRIKKMIERRGSSAGEELFKSNEVDPVIFWFEYMDWMVHNKNSKFISIIFDEADELFPASPGGARWHLNLWAKDVIKDLRRRRISLFLACHGYQDLDGRIKPKIQYKVWMKGSVTMPESLVNRRAPMMLEPGVYYIERDGWGMHSFDKIPEKSIILTYTDGCDERDDFGEDGESPSPPSPPSSTPKDDDEEIKKESDTKIHNGISEDYITRDEKGNILSIDFTKLSPSITITSESPKTKKKKQSTRKKPVYTKSSYIVKRKSDKDNVVDIAKKYDDKMNKGEIDEVKVPKPDRNDNTTDEIDK
jgi:hypothetical protein